MIELLGVGVRRDRGAWLLRNVCATVEAGELVLIVSPQTEERRALIDAVTGRRVPDEGRLWVNHVPLLRATARRIRGLGGLVELPGRLAGERSILWNALAPTGAVRALGGLLHCHVSATAMRSRSRSSASAFAADPRSLPRCSACPTGSDFSWPGR
jgi:hypothetical protein